MNGTKRGPAQKERDLAVTPTCIIFSFCPSPRWRKGRWLRRLPSTTGSPREAGSCAPLIAEGWASLLVQKDWGEGQNLLMWQSMGST